MVEMKTGEGAAYIQKWCHSGSWHLTGQYYPDADADADDADADADACNEWLLVTMQTAGNFQEKWDFPPSGILKQEVLDPAPLYLKILEQNHQNPRGRQNHLYTRTTACTRIAKNITFTWRTPDSPNQNEEAARRRQHKKST